MRFRIASIAFLLAVASTGVSWLTLQPSLTALLQLVSKLDAPAAVDLASKVRALLPFNLVIDLVVASVIAFLVIHFTVGRPLRATEEAVERLSKLELDAPVSAGGPLLARLQGSLNRLTDALAREQALTKQQVRELTATNQKLVRAQAELLAADRLATVGKLAAGVAHEVGNPLSGILGYLSVLQSRSKTDEQAEIIRLVEAEVGRIDQIVRSLLDLGRAPRGKAAPVEVGQVARAAVKLLSKSPELSQVKLDVSLPSELYVMAEPGNVSQVLINLLLNAGQAMGGAGVVRIEGERVGREVVVRVRDSGPGLPPDVLAHLFEPFFTTKPAGKGTGLGLAVSRHLVTSLGGRLEATNLSGGGAEFTMWLPAP